MEHPFKLMFKSFHPLIISLWDFSKKKVIESNFKVIGQRRGSSGRSVCWLSQCIIVLFALIAALRATTAIKPSSVKQQEWWLAARGRVSQVTIRGYVNLVVNDFLLSDNWSASLAYSSVMLCHWGKALCNECSVWFLK